MCPHSPLPFITIIMKIVLMHLCCLVALAPQHNTTISLSLALVLMVMLSWRGTGEGGVEVTTVRGETDLSGASLPHYDSHLIPVSCPSHFNMLPAFPRPPHPPLTPPLWILKPDYFQKVLIKVTRIFKGVLKFLVQ